MYGKTLADFPERFDEFLDEFKRSPLDLLDAAFCAARGACIEFPTPADVRRQFTVVAKDVEFKRLQAETRERLDRGAKPPGWIPLVEVTASPEFQQALVKTTMKPAAPVAKRRVILPLTEAEHNARIAELRRQAESLGVAK